MSEINDKELIKSLIKSIEESELDKDKLILQHSLSDLKKAIEKNLNESKDIQDSDYHILQSITYFLWYCIIGLFPYWLQLFVNSLEMFGWNYSLKDLNNYFNRYAILYTLFLIVSAHYYKSFTSNSLGSWFVVTTIVIDLILTAFLMGYSQYWENYKGTEVQSFPLLETILPWHFYFHLFIIVLFVGYVSFKKANFVEINNQVGGDANE